jgi:hypothetical protein
MHGELPFLTRRGILSRLAGGDEAITPAILARVRVSSSCIYHVGGVIAKLPVDAEATALAAAVAASLAATAALAAGLS